MLDEVAGVTLFDDKLIIRKCMNGRINKEWIAVNLQYLKCWLLSTNPPLEVLGHLTVKSTGPYHKTGGTAGAK